MKQTIFTLLLLSTIALVSCRKKGVDPNIKQFDDSQIQSFITAHGITGMQRDPTGGDTSGIYYKILTPGTGQPLDSLDYPDDISFVFTLHTFDGKYNSTDTIVNHYQGLLGHIIADALPKGLEMAIKNNLKYSGGSMRVLIPSHLAYGVNGYGSGSITNVSSRIAGNQCLDYYVHVIAKQPDPMHAQLAYDNKVIQNYLASKGTASLFSIDSGIYYQVTTQGTGAGITDNTTAEVSYNGSLLNGTVFDGVALGVDSLSVQIPSLIHGVSYILKRHALAGSVISIIVPSNEGYGKNAPSGIPPNSCLRFDFTIRSVTP